MRFKNCETCQYRLSYSECALPNRKRTSSAWRAFLAETSIREQIYPECDCPTWVVDRELLDKAQFLLDIGVI